MKILFTFLLVIAVLSSSCKKNDNEILINTSEINGVIQMGPFIKGTSIIIYEIDSSFSVVGKDYSSQVLDNSGFYKIENISQSSPYFRLKAKGYYFNEITGQNTNSPLTLEALTESANNTSVNVNILSHFEKNRVEYLMSLGESSFQEAKELAIQEILNIFSITKSNTTDFNLLNISQEGDNNAILLAISIITQGFRDEVDLSHLLAAINDDLRQDGKLDNPALGSMLINDARLLNLSKIRQNLENKYLDIGLSVNIPDFEKYITNFIDSTAYVVTNIEYPEFSNYGENILFSDKIIFGKDLSLAAILPIGTTLKIIIKDADFGIMVWPKEPVNWSITHTGIKHTTINAIESGKSCDLSLDLKSYTSNTFTVEYYENESQTPTRIKTFIY